MPKNIVILSDGTGQDGGKGHDSNIYKLFRMLEDRTDRQIVFYDEGLGTDWHKLTGNAFGAGFSKNLLQCYKFIFDNYNSGDRIFLFGFSRGAATVRSLASFIHYFGILPQSRPELIKKAFKLYEKGQDKLSSDLFKRTYNMFKGGQADEVDDELNKKATQFVHEHPNQWVKVEFLGVWDTVPALGLVALAGLNTALGKLFRYSFHDFKLHPSVKNAYHALSIDDDRLWFHPSLWTQKTREEQIVEQVWFSGAHTDIGGGFNESGLSDITLEWMFEKAVSYGLRIHLGSREYWNFVVAPDPVDLYHPPRKGFGKIFKKGPRNNVWNDQGASAAFGRPVIHRSVLDRYQRSLQSDQSKSDSDEKPWILEETIKSSIYFSEDEFKEFLRQKFYDNLKYEWKKYDWKQDKPQTKRFDEWIKESDYKEYYNSYDWDFYKSYKEDEYKKYSIKCWQEKKKAESQSEWLKKNPYPNEKGLISNWLESYRPYKYWLKEHTVQHDKQTYYVEPFSSLAFEKSEDAQCYSPMHEAEKEKPIEPGMYILSLRDYDKRKLEKIFKGTASTLKSPIREVEITNFLRKAFQRNFTVVKFNVNENKEIIDEIDSKNKKLIKRGINTNKKKHDRIGYDLRRWFGDNEAESILFSTTERDNGKEI